MENKYTNPVLCQIVIFQSEDDQACLSGGVQHGEVQDREGQHGDLQEGDLAARGQEGVASVRSRQTRIWNPGFYLIHF